MVAGAGAGPLAGALPVEHWEMVPALLRMMQRGIRGAGTHFVVAGMAGVEQYDHNEMHTSGIAYVPMW